MDDYIPTRNTQLQYERALARFVADTSVSEHNRALVQKFLRDAALGKTVHGRAKKRIGPSRLHGCLLHLQHVLKVISKNLDNVDQSDMENFIEALDGIPRTLW